MDNVKSECLDKKKGRLATKFIVETAVMAALLSALKFALSFIPNVEVVTLLILVYSATFGFLQTLISVLVFCAVDTALYGMGTWVLLYFLYWPLLAFLGAALLKRKQNLIAAVLLAVVMSVLFGVLSACADTVFLVAGLSPSDLSKYWVAYYVRGLYFDLAHVVSNAVIVALLWKPLTAVFCRIHKTE